MADEKLKLQKAFAKLDESWRSEVLSYDTPEVFKKISTTVMKMIAMEMAKKFDQDLNRVKEQLATINEGYTDAKKENTTRVHFMMEMLRDRGVDVPSMEDFMKKAQDEDAIN